MKSRIYTSLLAILFFSCTSKITFDPVPPVVIVPNSDLLISEISTAINTDPNAAGTRSHYIELYNGTGAKVDLVDYAIVYYACKDTFTLEDFKTTNYFILAKTIDTNKCFVIASPQCDVNKVPRDTTWGTTSTTAANASNPLQLSGNSAIALLKKDAGGAYNIGGTMYKMVDVFGSPLARRNNFQGTPSSRNNIFWTIGDEKLDTRNRTFFRKPSIKNPTTNWDVSRGTDAASSQWTMSGDRAWDYTNVGLPTQ